MNSPLGTRGLSILLKDVKDPAVSDWVRRLAGLIRERFPKADFYPLRKRNAGLNYGIYLGVGARRSGSDSGKNAFIVSIKQTHAKIGLQHNGQFARKYGPRLSTTRLYSHETPDLAQVGEWLSELYDTVDTLDRSAFEGEGHSLDDYLDAQGTFSEETTDVQKLPASIPLNQILYGPPGTGKTYSVIEAALKILDPEFLATVKDDVNLSADERRRCLKDRFDHLHVAERRIGFVTFHQSFSYEDFIEGLRAVSNEDAGGGISYRVEEGAFLQLCQHAIRDTDYEQDKGIEPEANVWKISIGEVHDEESRRLCFERGEARIGWPDLGDLRSANLEDPQWQLGPKERSCLNYFGREIKQGDILICRGKGTSIAGIGVVSGEYRHEPVAPAGMKSDFRNVLPVRWLTTQTSLDILSLNAGIGFTQSTVYALSRIKWVDIQNALDQKNETLSGAPPVKQRLKQRPAHVMIIDEINRGNVSRIFGELITLIETSKREGANEALQVMLPYSKKLFSVPANVYLIGTMNTADRSLAAMDVALRRRFVFQEMPPRADLLDNLMVEGINIGRLLSVMNQRIEVLLDRDHRLGHAYFMSLHENSALSELESIFRAQILPLLQEYFFDDWSRIQLVFNDHRKSEDLRFVNQAQCDFAALLGPDHANFSGRAPWQINEDAFLKADAYLQVIDHRLTATSDDEEDPEPIPGVALKEEVAFREYRLECFANDSVKVKGVNGYEKALPLLRSWAPDLGVELEWSTGRPKNTRHLGRELIQIIRKQSS